MGVAKNMNKILSNKKMIDEILFQSRDMDEVYEKLGYVLSFSIATRSKKQPTHQLNNPEGLYSEPEVLKLSKDKLADNIITNGYVTHSFNGYNLKNVKKYGLGTEKIYDKELGEEFDFLCAQLGEGEYTENQGGGADEIYYTAPGTKTFHYACGYSPERLWLGPLKQDRNNALPVKVGESKQEYAMRVLENKVNSLAASLSDEQKQEILAKGKSVIEKMCSQNPVVALIPIKSKKHSLTAYHATTKRDHKDTPMLKDILENGTGTYSKDRPTSFFTENTHLIEFNNLGNFVHVGNIRPSELEFFEVEDVFSLMQRKAKLLGLQDGDEIDYFTGKKYIKQEIKTEAYTMSVKQTNTSNNLKEIIKQNKLKKQTKKIDNKIEEENIVL